MTEPVGYLMSDTTRQRVANLLAQSVGAIGGGGDGEGSESIVTWVKITDAATGTTLNMHKGVATYYDPESQDWTDDTDKVKVRGPVGSESYTVGGRYPCVAWGWDGTADASSNMSGDFPHDVDGDDVAPWFVVLDGTGEVSFWAKILTRAQIDGGIWVYGWREQLPKKKGTWSDGPRQGTTGAWVEVVRTAAATATEGEVWSVTVHSATSGTFQLTVDGTATADIAYDAGTATISGALAGAGASLNSGTLQFTDLDPHSITWSKNNLKPTGTHMLFDANNKKIDPLNTIERIWRGYYTAPKLTLTLITGGNADEDVSTVWQVTIEGAQSGTYTLTWDTDGDPTSPLAWDAPQSAIQTALDTEAGDGTVTVSAWTKDGDDKVTYRITSVTADYYTLAGDGSGLVGYDDYRCRWFKEVATDPPGSDGTCIDVVTDVGFDADTCTPSKTFTTIKVLGVFSDLDGCSGGG